MQKRDECSICFAATPLFFVGNMSKFVPAREIGALLCMEKRNKKKFRVFFWKIVYAIGQINVKGVNRYVYSGNVSDEGFLYGEDTGL